MYGVVGSQFASGERWRREQQDAERPLTSRYVPEGVEVRSVPWGELLGEVTVLKADLPHGRDAAICRSDAPAARFPGTLILYGVANNP